jgi:hypothetical protein
MKLIHTCLLFFLAVPASIVSLTAIAQPQPTVKTATVPEGPSLDFTVKYYNRVLSPEGVLRESHYEEKMMRRPGNVWAYRVLPAHAKIYHEHEEHLHSHFNHVVVPRHITFDGHHAAIDFVDANEKIVVSIEPTEFENVSFDGSWLNAYFLVDPDFVRKLPMSTRKSPVTSAHWHETEKDGVFQRILWDDKNMIPLIAESGDLKHTFFNRVEVQLKSGLSKELPWTNLKGYSQKIYADFLD